MTLYESTKEWYFKGTLSSWESHTITIFVTSSIATIAAGLMRAWVVSLNQKEKEIALKEKLLASHSLVLAAVNHIVNNVVNYLQIVQLEIENEGRVQPDTLRMLNESVEEASRQMRALNDIQTPEDPGSYVDIFPKK